jgi:UDP-2,4-diacetamido-2,4,6-trideoxy-beta-L-altropyranose hydrolase
MVSIAIRVDLNPKIGLGHFSRCLTLSEELLRRGIEVHLISHPLPLEWENYAVATGAQLHLLDNETSGCSDDEALRPLDESDARMTANVLATNGIETLIVDSYQVTEEWAQIAAQNARLIILDDSQNVSVESAIRIDFGMSESPKISRRSIFCGPRFSLVHPSYRLISQLERVWRKSSQSIFIYLGATFRPDAIAQVLELVGLSLRSGTSVALLSSDFLRYGNLINDWRRQLSFKVVRDSRTLADTLQHIDFSIGAAGMSSMERACAGVPSLQLILTKNQSANAEWLQREGAAESLDVSQLKDSEAQLRLSSLLNDPDLLESMSDAGKRLVDGLGALRVAELINPTNLGQIVMRQANAKDIWTFLDWKNDPSTRQNSLNTDVVDYKTHRRWFQQQISNDHIEMAVFEFWGLPIAQIRLAKSKDTATISYSVDAVSRERGLGKKMISELVHREREVRRFTKLIAVVKSSNSPSISIFKSAGFSATRSSKSEIHFEIEV